MTTWYTQPVFGSQLAVALVALALLALLAVRPLFRKLSWRQHASLLALRVALIGLVILALLRPARVSTTSKPQTGVIMVLADTSRSMQLTAGDSSRSRYEAQLAALDSAAASLDELSARFDVKLYGYDSDLTPVDLTAGRGAWPAKPLGKETDLGSNLADATRRELGRRILGVVLLGDGVQTALEPRIETQAAARELGRLGAPLFTTVFGPVGAAAQSRDVAMEYMQDQYTVFVNNEVVIRGLARITGYVNKDIPVELLLEDDTGQVERIGTQHLITRLDGQQLEVSFPYTPSKPGQYKLTLRAPPQPGELVTKNNELQSFLNVLEGGLKVVYLEGELRPEQKFLRRSLNDSPDIDVDFQWIDHRRRDQWPVNLGELLSDPDWDVLIIGDLAAAALGDENLKALEKLVADRNGNAHGKGLAMLGGYHSFGAGGYQNTPLANVLPITMDRFLKQDFGVPIVEKLHLPGPLPLQPLADHPLVQLGAKSDNASLWTALPPLRGANRFAGVKASARPVLGSGTHPILVPGEYGDGRVVAFAGDSTWQWWMQGHQSEHRRFWRQMILWLAQREDTAKNNVWLTLRQRRYNPGAQIAFEVGAKSPTGDDIPGATFQVEVTLPSGKKEAARLTQQGPAWNGLFTATAAPGDYRLDVTALLDGAPLGTAQTQFLVFDQDLELASQAADPELMARLANLTKESGGRVVAPEQLSDLFRELLEKPRETLVEVQTKWQLGDTALDGWLFLLCFVTLATSEWFLRKRWGLV
jgi:uncharacterized membrane protein